MSSKGKNYTRDSQDRPSGARKENNARHLIWTFVVAGILILILIILIDAGVI